MEEPVFHNLLERCFIESNRHIEGTKPLILDGHRSHLSLRVVDLALANNVCIICLPAHTTYLLQPLDVAVFKALKLFGKKM
jgi:hypothetical protein